MLSSVGLRDISALYRPACGFVFRVFRFRFLLFRFSLTPTRGARELHHGAAVRCLHGARRRRVLPYRTHGGAPLLRLPGGLLRRRVSLKSDHPPLSPWNVFEPLAIHGKRRRLSANKQASYLLSYLKAAASHRREASNRPKNAAKCPIFTPKRGKIAPLGSQICVSNYATLHRGVKGR